MKRMLNLSTVLALYPDAAGRRAFLELSLAQARADLAAIRQAVAAGDYVEARQQTHRAKGTVSFLGTDPDAMRHLDALTAALRAADPARIALAHAPAEASLQQLEAELLRQLAAIPAA
ncbi:MULTISPECIES: hypothetical protein [Bordetella]|uniref:HPt domain-containing protein n=2 Tax=Bordetella TaxID=517 RepID=A0A261VQ44_9BORD|nr:MULTISPECIES: hypothetical protein [Bordetella]MDM9559277.1 hypothetical protein [Bordetella petrii]OZI76236.1 hypothetical protein CAL24_13815 [Bordetella genomosp. 2]